jgi:hypothetical protein
MKRAISVAATITYCCAAFAYADYTVKPTGAWPESWPVELGPLRKQARTLEGPVAPDLHYAIRFTKREDFEAAWPHIVKVKRKGAPLFLKRGPNFFLGWENKAGVVVHCPYRDATDHSDRRVAPVPGGTNDGVDGRSAASLELIVDGEIVDLNRISLPPDTPIIDERFKDGTNTPSK